MVLDINSKGRSKLTYRPYCSKYEIIIEQLPTGWSQPASGSNFMIQGDIHQIPPAI